MFRRRSAVKNWLVLALLLGPGLITTASAQQIFGSIYGTVTDASGAAVANAQVTIADPAKGATFHVTTNESGNYTKGQLIPGNYQVQIEAHGFSKAVSTGVSVVVDQAARFDVIFGGGECYRAGRCDGGGSASANRSGRRRSNLYRRGDLVSS